uniref:Transmembrane protein 211 n=1 Tax=Pavo cristatus TaxID=9049 RepID=A0A8C9FU08_PAVCR
MLLRRKGSSFAICKFRNSSLDSIASESSHFLNGCVMFTATFRTLRNEQQFSCKKSPVLTCCHVRFLFSSPVFIMASGLLVYPFGFNSATVKRFCENSDIYYAGDCQIGWGYMLAIVGVMLSVFLPFFAKYAPKDVYRTIFFSIYMY